MKPGERIDNYVLRRRLGQGGQGEVWLATDTDSLLDVALKIPHKDLRTDTEYVEGLIREGRHAIALNSPFIVRVYRVQPRFPYVAMEFCGDGDLKKLLKARKPLTLSRILDVIEGVCRALDVAHQAGLLHRDIKPGNILFSQGKPKVADFGLSKLEGSGTVTKSHQFKATPAYASPEALDDPKSVDQRTDVFGIGLLLYEMLTWRRPFMKRGDGFSACMYRLTSNEPFPPPFELEPSLQQVLDDALSRDRGQRIGSAADFLQRIEQLRAEFPEADTMLFPPEHVIEDADRLATKIAQELADERTDAAVQLLAQLKEQDEENSLAIYYSSILRDEIGAESDSTVETNLTPEQQVEELLSSGDISTARDIVAGMMSKGTSAQVVIRLMSKVEETEKALDNAVASAQEQADEALRRREWKQARDAWEDLARLYASNSMVRPIVDKGMADVESAEQNAAWKSTRGEARDLLDREQLDAALQALDGYLSRWPQHKGALALREDVSSKIAAGEESKANAAKEQRAYEHLVNQVAEASAAGDLASPRRLITEFLAERPGHAEATAQLSRIDQAIANRAFAEVSEQADRDRFMDDLESAVDRLEAFLQQYPGHREAEAKLQQLRQRWSKKRLDARISEFEELRQVLEDNNMVGRYGSLEREKGVLKGLAEDMFVVDTSDGVQLETLCKQAREEFTSAEGELARRVEQLRSTLVEKTLKARSLAGSVAKPLPQLDSALARAYDVLATGGLTAGAADPIPRPERGAEGSGRSAPRPARSARRCPREAPARCGGRDSEGAGEGAPAASHGRRRRAEGGRDPQGTRDAGSRCGRDE